MYQCDTCQKMYKYKRNLLRHVKERHREVEHWNCPVEECTSKFIRRGYLCKHLILKHGYTSLKSRESAISATRGNAYSQNSYYDDVSDDDSILDLLSYNDTHNDFGPVLDSFDLNMLDETNNSQYDDVSRNDVRDVDVNDCQASVECKDVEVPIEINNSGSERQNDICDSISDVNVNVNVNGINGNQKDSGQSSEIKHSETESDSEKEDSYSVVTSFSEGDNIDVDVDSHYDQNTENSTSESIVDENNNCCLDSKDTDLSDDGSDNDAINNNVCDEDMVIISSDGESSGGDSDPEYQQIELATSQYKTKVWNFTFRQRLCIRQGQEYVLGENIECDYFEFDK